MARQTLVVDASVGVKWFSGQGEAHVSQARTLLSEYAAGNFNLVVPDLFFHEIANALVHKAAISVELLLEAITTLGELNLAIFPVNAERLRSALQLAREAGITEYDAFYAVAARDNSCPLVTANPRHQGRQLGCPVIPLEEWRQGAG